MKIIMLALVFLTPLSALENAQDFNGKPSWVRKYYADVYKKNGKWTEGAARNEFETRFSREGLVLSETEKSGGSIVLVKRYEYKSGAEASAYCANLVSEAKKSGRDSESLKSQIFKFCSENGTDISAMTAQYNLGPGEKTGKLFRTVFSIKRKKSEDEWTFDCENSLEYQTVYQKNKKGEMSEKTKYGPDLSLMEKETDILSSPPPKKNAKFTDANDILKKEVTEERRMDGTMRKKTEIIYDDLEQVFSKTEVSCDGSGRPLQSVKYSQDGTPEYEENYSYEFDSSGNWIKEVKSRKDYMYGKKTESQSPPQITSREIKYYQPVK